MNTAKTTINQANKTTVKQGESILKKNSTKKLLGEILQDAGLISAAQIQIALQDQSVYDDMRIGEILALRGWIRQETSDFFADKYLILRKQQHKKPIGYYLKEAALLDESQIKAILAEQVRQTTPRVRFGKLVVLKGWLKQDTIDFFLDNLSSRAEQDKVYISQTVLKTLNNHPFQKG